MDTIIVKVDEQGNLTIPKQIMSAQGFTSSHREFCLVPMANGFLLKAALTDKEKKLLADFDAQIQSQLGNITGQTPVFGDLTVDEYLSLSEEEQDKLWDLAFEEAYQSLKDTEELEVGGMFQKIVDISEEGKNGRLEG